MKYKSPLIAVTDMERSKAFYKKYLCLDVEVDFGANVTLTGGIALQTLDSWRGFIGGIDVSFKNNAVELYFEEDDFDTFDKLFEFMTVFGEHDTLARCLTRYRSTV